MTEQYESGPASLFVTAARADEKPNFVLAPLLESSDGKTFEVIGVKWGEMGYYPTTYGRQTREWIAEQNLRMGIEPAVAAAYSMCSMFGWAGYENGLQSIRDALAKAVAKCCCYDKVGDNDECAVHGKGKK